VSEGLIVPKQVEYLVVKPSRRRLPLAGALSLLAVAGVVGIVLVKRNISKPHKYPVLQMPSVGLKASLITKWVNGSGEYKFQVRPTPGNEARFVSVVQTIPLNELGFEFHLLDSDGFEVCSAIPTTMIPSREPDGKAASLRADETFLHCTEE